MTENPPQNSSFLANSSAIEEKINKFMLEYAKEVDSLKKVEILHSFTDVYLVEYDQSLMSNSNGFFKVVCEVPHLCESFLRFRCSYDSETESETFLIELAKQIEYASLCFDIIQKVLKAVHVMSQTVLPVTEVALKLLLLGYKHCQDSETIYGEFLEKLVEDLGRFFKKIESVQMVMLEKLKDLHSIKYSEEGSAFYSFMSTFVSLCEVIEIDPNTASEMWNAFFRLLSQNPCLLNSVDLNSVSEYLASKSTENFLLVKNRLGKEVGEDDENFEQMSMYLNQLSSVLSLAVDGSFKLVEKSILQLRYFLTAMLEILIECSSFLVNCPLIDVKEFLNHKAYHILSGLLKMKDIQESIIKNKQSIKKDLRIQFSQSAVFLSNICCLQFLRDSGTEEKILLFCNILSILSSSQKEIDAGLLNTRVPKCAITKSDSTEEIDLYQFTFEELSIFLKSVPDLSIQDLNCKVLLEFSTFSDVAFLLMADVWSYRLRCCEVSFLMNVLSSVLQSYNVRDSQEKVKFGSFIKRMLNFLPPTQKKVLQQEFPFLPFLQNDGKMHRHGTPDLFSSDFALPDVSDEKLNELMSKLDSIVPNDVQQLIEKSCSMIEIFSLLVNEAGCSEILQFIDMVLKLFKSEVYEIQVTVLTFIKALSHKQIPENSKEFGVLVNVMTELFFLAITSKNYIISCEALNTFNYFAKCTPHVKIVQETVKRNPSLKPLIKTYLAAIPESGFLTKEEKSQSIQHCLVSSRTQSDFGISQSSRNTLMDIFSSS